MSQDQAAPTDPDAWSGLAALYERPQQGAVEREQPSVASEPEEPLAEALLQLTATLEDERTLRLAAEEQVRLGIAEIARLTAELAAERTRIAQIERDRDDVLHRAEELLTGMRERADQRVADEVETANRHWSDLLAEERRRVERLDRERTGLLKRLEQALTPTDAKAAPPRPRPRPKPAPAAEDVAPEPTAEEPAAPGSEPAELEAEMKDLRQRLRARLRRAPDMDDVEDGVDALREARLARENQGRRRR